MQKYHMSSRQSEWLNTRSQLLRSVKRRVRLLLGNPASEIQIYSKKYDREFQKNWKISSRQELLHEIQTSQLVFAADFHAHAQAQRTHLRVLRSLPSNLKVVIGVECVEEKYQLELDKFISGKVAEKTFLAKVKWSKNWGFNWEHYKPIFELAKQKKYRVLALNKLTGQTKRKSLKKRERFASQLIASNLKADSKSLYYIIFGEFHLARAHLPNEVFQSLGFKPKYVILYQNSEKIYFKLAKKNLENEIDVVRLSKNQFCIINSPPWVKWQSYLISLEKKLDLDLDDIEGGENYIDVFLSQLKFLGKEFKIPTFENELTICLPGEWKASRFNNKKNENDLIRHYILSEHGFVYPSEGIVYLPRLSLNHVSSMTGQWLLIKNANIKKQYWKMPEDFERLVFIEAIGFFASKLINPARKQDTLEDLKSEVGKSKKSQLEVLKLCLSYKRRELFGFSNYRSPKLYKPRHKASYYESAKKLGALLGEQMFWGYRNGYLQRKLIKEWFCYSFEKNDFIDFYQEQVKKLNRLPVVIKNKQERL